MYYPRQLSDHIAILGNHYLQTYLIRGDKRCILIEPGISTTAREVIDQMTSIHMEPSRIDLLCITHPHADHVTGAPVLKEMLPQLVVASSVEAQRLLKKNKVQDSFIQDDHDISVQLRHFNAIGDHEHDTIHWDGLVGEIIHPGESIDLGGISLKIIDAPGHCIGGLAFYLPQEKALFCSDYLGFFVKPDQFVPNFYVNLNDYMATFKSLTELEADLICPGHCGVYPGQQGKAFIQRSRAEIEWVCDYVRNYAEDPEVQHGLREALFERYYIHEAKMFSERSTRYCMDLIIRRIMEGRG